MVHVQYLHIIVAVLLAFLISTLYYAVLNRPYKRLLGEQPDKNGKYKMSMTPNRIIVEITRNFVLGIFLAYAIAGFNFLYWNEALILAAWIWIGIVIVFLVGLVAHEKYSKGLAAIHAGDWLLKLVLFSVLLTLWR